MVYIFVYVVLVSFVNNINIVNVEHFHIWSLYIFCNPLLQNIVQVKCLTLYERTSLKLYFKAKKEASVKVQIQPIPLKSLEEENTPKVISCTKSTIKKEQPLQEKGMSVQELVEKYMNEGENMVEMSFKGQQKNLPSNLEVIKEEKNLLYNEDITSRNDEELEKLQRVENDA